MLMMVMLMMIPIIYLGPPRARPCTKHCVCPHMTSYCKPNLDKTIYLTYEKNLRPREANILSDIPSQLMDEEVFGKTRGIFHPGCLRDKVAMKKSENLPEKFSEVGTKFSLQ